VPGFAVTPALREAYASGDEEELEYAALTEAARASLRLIAEDPAAPPRRVVLAAEIPAEQVKLDADDDEPARVLVTTVVPLNRLASAHVDDAEAAADVRAAADALPAADAAPSQPSRPQPGEPPPARRAAPSQPSRPQQIEPTQANQSHPSRVTSAERSCDDTGIRNIREERS
jgi:hypothetical protein